MSSKQNANPLKTLVISMGVLLIGGTVLLMAVVWKKVSQEAMKAHAASECAGGKIDLTGRGKIVNRMTDGHIVRIELKKQAGQDETVSIDLCTGKIVGALVIDSDKN